jgi:ATP-dependent Clp protease ATP-binding subunit ClpC
MFERFTETARKGVFFARYEASQTGSAEIDTEHLLLGILRASTVLLAKLFPPVTSLESIRQGLYKNRPIGEHVSESVDMPVSAASKRVLENAVSEADRLKDSEITPEHMLAGLLREESSPAAALLKNYGVTPARLRQGTVALISRQPAELAVRERDAISGCRDLTAEAEAGALGPLVGRERELERLALILSRRTRNNAVLIGESGVGKTAILEGFAQRTGYHRMMLEVDASALLPSGNFDEILAAARQENAILCIDRLFAVPGAAVFLAPYLTRGEIQCIVTGTAGGLRRTIELAEGLMRHFEVVNVPPPDENAAIGVLTGLKERYENFHGVVFSPGTIEAAVYASGRFLPHRNLPDRALDLMDEAGARAKVKKSSAIGPEDIAQVIADRSGFSLAAVNAVLAQKSAGRLDRMAAELARRVPLDGNEWVAFLAAYLARCSKEEAAILTDAIAAAHAVVSNEE